MRKKFKILLIVLGIIMLIGIILGCIWYFYWRKKKVNYHKRKQNYRLPDLEKINKLVKKQNLKNFIPKTVYMIYNDLDGIPDNVMENIKKYCKGYKIEIHGDQSCEDFLYEYYGPDAMQLYRELEGARKADFWRYCILYVKGGYYFDIKTDFQKHIDEIFRVNEKKTWYTVKNIAIISPPLNPELWLHISHYFKFNLQMKKETKWHHINLESKFLKIQEWKKLNLQQQLELKHRNLSPIDTSKLDVPILYVNMDKDKDRLKFIKDQFKGFNNLHRVPGIDGSTFKFSKPYTISKGEMGCFMAHINAIKTIIKNNWDKVLIIEDDSSLQLSSRWPWKLSELATPCILSHGNSGYILDQNTANRIVDSFEKLNVINEPCDIWIYTLLNIYDKKISNWDSLTKYKFGYISPNNNISLGIYQYNNSEIISTINDRPWSALEADNYANKIALNIIDFYKLKLIQIDENGKVQKVVENDKISIVSSWDEHYECLGALALMYKDKFDIEVYYNYNNTEGAVEHFSKDNYKFFDLNYANLYEDKFIRIIKLTAADPLFIKNQNKLISIKHIPPLVAKKMGWQVIDTPASFITLSPLVTDPISGNDRFDKKQVNITPIYDGKVLPDRKKQIVIVGSVGIDNTNILDLAKAFNYKIIIAQRLSRKKKRIQET